MTDTVLVRHCSHMQSSIPVTRRGMEDVAAVCGVLCAFPAPLPSSLIDVGLGTGRGGRTKGGAGQALTPHAFWFQENFCKSVHKFSYSSERKDLVPNNDMRTRQETRDAFRSLVYFVCLLICFRISFCAFFSCSPLDLTLQSSRLPVSPSCRLCVRVGV